MRNARSVDPRRTAASSMAAMALFAAGCAWTPQVVFDERADFASFRSWDWDPRESPPVVAPQRNAAQLRARLDQLIEGGFRSLGYARGRSSPDFRVAYRMSLQRRREVVGVARAPYLVSSMSYSPSYWVEGTDAEERFFEHLQLVIEVMDREGSIVWKGGVRRRVDDGRSPDLPEAVSELLERFPRASAPAPPVHVDQVALRTR